MTRTNQTAGFAVLPEICWGERGGGVLAQGFLFIGDGLVVGGGDFFVVVEEDAVDRQPSGFAGVDQFFVFELECGPFPAPLQKQSGPPAAGRSLPRSPSQQHGAEGTGFDFHLGDVNGFQRLHDGLKVIFNHLLAVQHHELLGVVVDLL